MLRLVVPELRVGTLRALEPRLFIIIEYILIINQLYNLELERLLATRIPGCLEASVVVSAATKRRLVLAETILNVY